MKNKTILMWIFFIALWVINAIFDILVGDYKWALLRLFPITVGIIWLVIEYKKYKKEKNNSENEEY